MSGFIGSLENSAASPNKKPPKERYFAKILQLTTNKASKKCISRSHDVRQDEKKSQRPSHPPQEVKIRGKRSEHAAKSIVDVSHSPVILAHAHAKRKQKLLHWNNSKLQTSPAALLPRGLPDFLKLFSNFFKKMLDAVQNTR